MQFHLDGYRTGDPEVFEPSAHAIRVQSENGALPREVDVLIVGCGPAGLTLAAQLSAFPGITTCIVEQKLGPLDLGQADGVACRTIEMFNAFGFAERVLKEGYWVNETTFWKPADDQRAGIVRSGRIRDTEDGLSEFPHVILNQARVHEFYLEMMRKSPGRLTPHYGWKFADVQVDSDEAAANDYPVTARLQRVPGAAGGEESGTIKARYVVGCDGARSAVRRAIGQPLKGDSANQAWGVMDVLVVTDFPDIRLKAVINSAEHGSIVVIPREGGYLVRIYVEMDELSDGERVAARTMTVQDVIGAAQRIFHPYSLDIKQVAWWSVYDIGQRLCDRFDNLDNGEVERAAPRVFIAGDACHTHSPKAGQGMNVSMQDAFNLGWKLAAVLMGRCAPDLLRTYHDERHLIAKELIEFDKEWAAMLSAPLKSPQNPQGVDAAEIEGYFVRSGRYTAGTATRYPQSQLTGAATHQHLAKGFLVGTRFHSSSVIRLADGKPMQLGHAAIADGRWRLYAFGSTQLATDASSDIAALCRFLGESAESPMLRYTRPGEDVDATIDLRVILQQPHRELALEKLPALLLPKKGRFGLVDYEKVFCPDILTGVDIFDVRGINRSSGCIVVVRPDQYIANVLPLAGTDTLTSFFAGFLLPQR